MFLQKGASMITTQKIPLDLKEKQIRALKQDFQQVIDFLEQGKSLTIQSFKNLQENLSNVVTKNAGWMEALSMIKKSGEYYHVNLCHPDSAILNLPWGLAIDPYSEQELYKVRQLFLSRTSCKDEGLAFPSIKAPLKILVMIAAPLDLPNKYRLNY
jgi:hypothetical protein